MPEIGLDEFDRGQEIRSPDTAVLRSLLNGTENMARNGLRRGDWVLICDSRKALLAVNVGDALTANLQVRKTWEHADLATHEQGTDKPGRAFSGADGERSAVDTTDLHRLEEEHFLAQVASELVGNVSQHQIKELVVVA